MPAPPEPVASATVLLLRDPPAVQRPGLEVLMVERHLDSDVLGGALVFPGGKVDPRDRELDAARWTGAALPTWRGRLGVDSDADALGLLTAAARECFEEAGVLLARREDGTPLTADDLAAPSFQEARTRAVERGAAWDWQPWLVDEGLTLAFDRLALWSWWVTPEGPHRRFDTRFFVALLPSQQVAREDGVETTALTWLRPSDALDAHTTGDATVIFPTRHNLRSLAGFATAVDVWDTADARQGDVRRTCPTIVEIDGQRLVQHPDGGPPEPV